MTGDVGRVLVICTGNVCRSPLAAAALRAAVPSVEVASAGTGAEPGAACPSVTIEEAHALDLDLRGHRASPLDLEAIRAADLVLALARQHRASVARLSPRAARRTFTLREAARLAALVEPDEMSLLDAAPTSRDRLADASLLLARHRGGSGMVAPDDDDVEDPMGRPRAVHELATRQIVSSLDALVRLLRHAPPIAG